MHCPHCVEDSSEHGADMYIEIFRAAIDMICKYKQNYRTGFIPNTLHVDIGGGEPTVHPEFWDLIDIACNAIKPGADVFAKFAFTKQLRPLSGLKVYTNGKNVEDALRLVDMAENGLLDVALSLDKYHESISSDVEYAFKCSSSSHVGIACAGNSPVRAGRAAMNDISTVVTCVCSEPIISSNGLIYACGCKSETFGSVFDYNIPARALIGPYYCSNFRPQEILNARRRLAGGQITS